jgi:hypothetical protein
VLQEGEGEAGRVTQAAKTTAEQLGRLLNRIWAEVRHFSSLDVVPNSFRWIKVGGIAGQPFDVQPVLLVAQEFLHDATAMGRKVIPDENHSMSGGKAFELLEELNQADRVIAVGFGASEQTCRFSIPAETQRRCHGNLAPVIASWSQDRGLAAWRPSGADGGLLRETGLVLEEDPGLVPDSVFFISGQRTSFQY